MSSKLHQTLLTLGPRGDRPMDDIRGLRTRLFWLDHRTNRNIVNNEATFWEVRSNKRPNKTLHFMKMRLVLGKASAIERQCLFDLPGFTEDRLLMAYLEALASFENPTSKIRSQLLKRLQLLQQLLGSTQYSYHMLNTWKDFVVVITQTSTSIRSPKKFSGYVRNPSAVGSKRMSSSVILEPDASSSISLRCDLDLVRFMIHEKVEPSSLGLSPGTLQYQVLDRYLHTGKELPDHFKHLIFYEIF